MSNKSTYFCPKCGENVPEYHECSDGSVPALTHPEGWKSDGTLAGGKRTNMNGWIGVDLDGTLAHYEHWVGPQHIGEPIPEMVERVKGWLAAGLDVRIFTARVSHDGTLDRINEAGIARLAIENWCQQYFGEVLPITNVKDYAMIELWDDRAVQVQLNAGKPVGYSTRGLA